MDTFGIPAAFVIVAALTLWAVIGSKGWWWIKAIIVAVTIFFSVALWNSIDSLTGWPTEDTLPQKFEIKWITAEEPNKKTGDPGEILVWALSMDKEYETDTLILHNKGAKKEPRLHRLPYSREMHKQAQQMQKRIGKGERIFAEMKKGKMQGQGQGKGKGKGQGQGQGQGKEAGRMGGNQKGDGGSLSQEQDPIFHELPPPHFIPKEG